MCSATHNSKTKHNLEYTEIKPRLVPWYILSGMRYLIYWFHNFFLTTINFKFGPQFNIWVWIKKVEHCFYLWLYEVSPWAYNIRILVYNFVYLVLGLLHNIASSVVVSDSFRQAWIFIIFRPFRKEKKRKERLTIPTSWICFGSYFILHMVSNFGFREHIFHPPQNQY